MSARSQAASLRRHLRTAALIWIAVITLVVWWAAALPPALVLAAIAAATAVLLWRWVSRDLDDLAPEHSAGPAAREAEALVAAVTAARGGDLTVRTQVAEGSLGPIGRGIDEMLDAFAALVSKLGAAAADVSVSAESIERFSRVLAERAGRQSVAIAEVARKLKGMGARSEEIGQIVELLEDVAAETNVLALNAALEASRAGTQGRGFGMVADEVRKLAERSAAATKDIGAFIQGIEATTDDTTRSVEEIRGLTEGVVTSASQTASAAISMLASSRTLAQALLRLRVPGQDETDLARALRARRSEIAHALEPIAPLLENARSPLGDALRQVLVVLAEGISRPPPAAHAVPLSTSSSTLPAVPAASGAPVEPAPADRPAPPVAGSG
jgi:ABC-type transporter Mla subunit MlaD